MGFIEHGSHELPVTIQAELLSLNQSSLYYQPQPPSAAEVALKHRIDELYTQWPFYGSRTLAPYALKGGYINLLDEGEQERVPLTFGANYERLLELKRTYDPNDVFHSTIGHIPPSAS